MLNKSSCKKFCSPCSNKKICHKTGPIHHISFIFGLAHFLRLNSDRRRRKTFGQPSGLWLTLGFRFWTPPLALFNQHATVFLSVNKEGPITHPKGSRRSSMGGKDLPDSPKLHFLEKLDLELEEAKKIESCKTRRVVSSNDLCCDTFTAWILWFNWRIGPEPILQLFILATSSTGDSAQAEAIPFLAAGRYLEIASSKISEEYRSILV